MGGDGLLKAQLLYARSVLKSAWSDFYFSTYTWTIVKARDAARHAVAALLRASGFNPPSHWPLALLVESVTPACKSFDGLLRDAVRLDFTVNLYTDTELYLVLWYAGNREAPPRSAALSSLESAIKIVEASESCNSPGRAIDARSKVTLRLYSAEYPGRHTVFISGTKLYVASTSFEGVDPLDRIDMVLDSIPVGLIPVLLAPDEAYALLNLPWPFEQETEIVKDQLGLSPLIKKRSP